MIKFRAWLAYSFYVLALGTFFVYILFPAEAVGRYIVARVADVYPDVRLSIGDVSPILPPGLKLHRVTIGQGEGEPLNAPEIVLYPRWLSLLGKRPAVTYKALAGRGNIRGTAIVAESGDGRLIRLDADLEGVRMEQLGFAPVFGGYRFEGVLSGRIRYTGKKKRTADARMTATDMTVATSTPVLGVRKLRFESVRTEAVLEERKLTIKRMTLAGNQLSGVLSGDIAIGRQLEDSTVSLGGTLQLSLRANGSGSATRPGSGVSLAGNVPVRISGTLGSPTVMLR